MDQNLFNSMISDIVGVEIEGKYCQYTQCYYYFLRYMTFSSLSIVYEAKNGLSFKTTEDIEVADLISINKESFIDCDYFVNLCHPNSIEESKELIQRWKTKIDRFKVI